MTRSHYDFCRPGACIGRAVSAASP